MQKKLIQNLNKKHLVHLLILFFFSIFFNFYYGYRGVFPIDTFFHFDAGNNILNGNHPFKDYWSVTGPIVDYIQSFFFFIFGTNWFGYVLHSSIINFIFSIFAYLFFIKLGLNNFLSILYALGVAILAYPSAGTPFVDHHAFIFSVLALFTFIFGLLTKKNFYWFLLPVFLTISFLSKQTTSVYLSLFFLLFFSFYYFFINEKKVNYIKYSIFGILFTFLFLSIFVLINKIPLENFLIQYIFYPSTIGEQRIINLDLGFKNLISQFKYIYISLIPIILIAFKLSKNKLSTNVQKKDFLILILFFCSVILFIFSQLLTRNQILIFSLIPIASGFSHAYVKKYIKSKYLVYFTVIIFLFSTVKYHIRFNENKKFMELSSVDFQLSINASSLDKRLNGLNWITPEYKNDPKKEIDLLLNIKQAITNEKNEKIIITDYQFFSALDDNYIPSPNKWYDDQSVPEKNNKYFLTYKKFFLSHISKNNVKKIFFVGGKKEIYFLRLIEDISCIQKSKYNELLIIYNIEDCNF